MNELISPEYKALYQRYYQEQEIPDGQSRWYQEIQALCEDYHCQSLLDYGSGPVKRFAQFEQEVEFYDPAIPGLDKIPNSADCVVCLDVIEHIEGRFVFPTIRRLQKLTNKILFVCISCQHSTKTLPDGSPWHISVRPYAWWEERLRKLGFMATPYHDTGRDEYTGLWIAE